MAKKQKQPAKTCADCIHEDACRVWTNGRAISDESASRCPNHETVKESGAYLCGVLDERNRKKTNGDRIRAMSDEDLARWMLQYQRQIIKETLRTLGTEEHVKAFEEALGENPDCTDIVRWLKEPYKEDD